MFIYDEACCPGFLGLRTSPLQYISLEFGMCYQPATFIFLFCTTSLSMTELKLKHLRKLGTADPCLIFISVLFLLFAALSVPVSKTLYFMNFAVATADVQGLMSLGIWGYCLNLKVPNGTITYQSCSPIHHLAIFSGYSLSEFKSSFPLIPSFLTSCYLL